jgi:hypothetical protein
MRLKLVGAIVVGILLTALSAAPASAITNTITIGTVTLTNRVLVEVPVTVVCDPVPDATQSFLGVLVRQASGQAIATGSAFTGSFGEPLLFTCDGVTQNHLVVDVLPDPNSPPFHGGGAIALADFSVSSFSISESGNTGYIPVKIRG